MHAVALALALTAGASNNPWLEKARAAYAKLDCDQVLADLAHAKEVPTDDAATKLSIFDYEGRCQVALGRAALAEAAFTQMLAIDPQAEMDPQLSPKIKDAFLAAKLKVFPKDYVAWKELPAGPELRRAELVDPWRKVATVVLGRWDDAKHAFAEETLAPTGNVYVAQVKERAFYLEARDASGASLTRLGSRDVPTPLPMPKAPVAVESKPLETAPPPASDPRGTRHIVGGVMLASGAAAVVGGVVLLIVGGVNRGAAQKAEWADDAYRLDSAGSAQAAVGHALFWPGLGVAVAGTVLSF